MTSPRPGIHHTEDFRLKQAQACAEKWGCETCEYFTKCQQDDNKFVSVEYNKMFQGTKGKRKHGVLGTPSPGVL